MSNKLVERIGSLKLQDLSFVLICVFSIYLLRAKQSCTLTPSWRRDFDTEYYENGKYPNKNEVLPLPVITDLDGDGSQEIVIVTGDLRLEVLVFAVGVNTSVLPHLHTLRSSDLLDNVRSEDPGYPVVLETGFVSHYKERKPRDQIILVVMSSWEVLCFTHTLELLWRRKLIDVPDVTLNYHIKSMAAMIIPHSLNRDDEGLVVVGGSFTHKGHHAGGHRLTETDESTEDTGEEVHERVVVADKKLTHFSTLALSANNGTVRWHHLPGDFGKTQVEEAVAHHWKLALKNNKLHAGETHWSNYGDDFLSLLPYSWTDFTDTHFELASLYKGGRGGATNPEDDDPSGIQATVKSTLEEMIGLNSVHKTGVQYGGMMPHSRHEHVDQPNSVVIYKDDGIEVLKLKDGHPITRLELPDPNTVYVDLDQDGNIDKVSTQFDKECLGISTPMNSRSPSSRARFMRPICEAPSVFGPVSFTAAFGRHYEQEEDPDKAVLPLVIKSVGRRSGFSNHLFGHSLETERRGYDSVFLTSTGRLTSYSYRGDLNWQVMTAATWNKQSARRGLGNSFYHSHEGEIYQNMFKPSLKKMALQIYGPETIALVLGWDFLTLVDLYDGGALGGHQLPCQPMVTPVVGDFSGDGYNDIIIICPNRLVGFTLQKSYSIIYMVIVSITVVLVLLFLSWVCKPNVLGEIL